MKFKTYIQGLLILTLLGSVATLSGCNADDGDRAQGGTGTVNTDRDGDGIANAVDNCPDTPNVDQSNLDPEQDEQVEGQLSGDACDPLTDTDNDGWPNPGVPYGGELDRDTCPYTYDESNLDSDNDGTGNACEGDKDEDGILDEAWNTTCSGGNKNNCNDNCIDVENPNQEDANYNGVGDVCDPLYHCEGFERKDLIAFVKVDSESSVTAEDDCTSADESQCSVTAVENTIDTNDSNVATMTISGGSPAAGSTATITITGFDTVKAIDTSVPGDDASNGEVGFIIMNPTDLFSAEFASSVIVETFMEDEAGTLKRSDDEGVQFQVDFFEAGSSSQDTPQRVLITLSPIAADFDTVRLTFQAPEMGGTFQASRDVYGACYSPVAETADESDEGEQDDFISYCYSYSQSPEFCAGLEEARAGGAPIPEGDNPLVTTCEAMAAQDDSGNFDGAYCSCFADPMSTDCPFNSNGGDNDIPPAEVQSAIDTVTTYCEAYGDGYDQCINDSLNPDDGGDGQSPTADVQSAIDTVTTYCEAYGDGYDQCINDSLNPSDGGDGQSPTADVQSAIDTVTTYCEAYGDGYDQCINDSLNPGDGGGDGFPPEEVQSAIDMVTNYCQDYGENYGDCITNAFTM